VGTVTKAHGHSDGASDQSAEGRALVGAIHHVGLRVQDVADASARWSHLLGLHGETAPDGCALLRCTYEDYALALRPAEGTPGLDYVCFELAPGVTLEDAARRIEATGTATSSFDLPGRGGSLRLKDPDGHDVALTPRIVPQDRRPAEVRESTRIPGWHPRKLGHVNFLTRDVQRQVQWYTNVLGFRVTDWIGTEGVWLHVNADHHVLAFLQKDIAHIHHLAFELVDWGEMRVALDHLAQNRRHVVWGPGRHGMARNLFSYVRMREEDLFVELFCDLEQLASDHEPRFFPDDPHSSNTWGILPPRTYFRFDPAAIAAEEEQAYAYGRTTP
jgi:catechol 2,3-dioxygenase-like lactoylglutathione lyase family enzyme